MSLSYFTQLFFGFLGHNQLTYTTRQRNEKLCFFCCCNEKRIKIIKYNDVISNCTLENV